MPTDSVYGEWPRSGEIDIAEMKGNAIGYENGGRDTIASTLHWGPTTSLNAWWRTVQGHKIRRTDYTKGYHTFGLEWSRKYIYTYVDNKLMVRLPSIRPHITSRMFQYIEPQLILATTACSLR